MNTTEAANEEVETNIVYMGDFLIRRLTELKSTHARLTEQADALSKMDKDKFAAPLRGKADALVERIEKTENQVRFILRGGRGVNLPNRGYSLSYGHQTPPPVRIEVSGIPVK